MSLTAGFTTEILKKVETEKSYQESLKLFPEFFLLKPLPIKLEAYIDHILYQLGATENLLALSYTMLMTVKDYLILNNLHKFVFTSISLSYKFLTDVPAEDSQLEKIGVLKTGELFILECAMLDVLDWEIHYSQYEAVYNLLLKAGDIKPLIECGGISDDEDDTTWYGTNESFSELSSFFS